MKRSRLLVPTVLLLAMLAVTAPAAEPGIPQRQPMPGDADYPIRNGNPRHEQKVTAAKAGKYDLVLIGDSITHSIGELDGKYAPNKAIWDRYFAPRHAINLGMNGQRTEEILWNLQNGELEFSQSPRVVMLLIGTNNADDRHFRKVHTPEQIFAGTKAIVDLIRKRHPATKILVLRIFPRGGDGEKAVSLPAFNSSKQCIETCRRAGELTAKLADGKQVFWLDVNHVFLRPDGTINTDLMWDLLHPSPAGTEAWVLAVEPTLAMLLGEDPRKQQWRRRWSSEKAWEWYNKQPWIVGFNFVTSTAVNDIEMWQADTFDPQNIDRELKIAASLGYNTARVFINYHLWEADAAGLKQRMEQYLAIADKHGLRTVWCPMDYCNFTQPRRPPKLGKQGEPNGKHGGNWVESPWEDIARDPKKFPLLKRYITDIVGSFAHDKRVLMWDLYNEPMPPVWELTMACFDWAREARPDQPITVGHQQHLDWRFAQQIFDRSDIVTFHLYGRADETSRRIEEIRKRTKYPLICTEWLNTLPGGKTDIPTCLPIYKRKKVGAICWGMMQGRLQTPIHDILRPDGTPLYPQDVEIVRKLTGAKGEQ